MCKDNITNATESDEYDNLELGQTLDGKLLQ